MATINIVDLRVQAIIGTKAWERKNTQEIVINISINYDASTASHSDKLSDTIDYEHITKTLIKTVEKSRCRLLEKLANLIISKLKGYKGLQELSVCIDKPQAIPQARCVSYRVSFRNSW